MKKEIENFHDFSYCITKGEKRSQVDVCWEKMLQDKSMLDELDMYDPVFLPFIIISFTSGMIYRSIKSTLLFKIV